MPRGRTSRRRWPHASAADRSTRVRPGARGVPARDRPAVRLSCKAMSGTRPDRVIRAFVDHLVVERGMARNTVDSYARDLRRYHAHLQARGRTDLAEVDAEDITAFLVALREGTEDFPPLA